VIAIMAARPTLLLVVVLSVNVPGILAAGQISAIQPANREARIAIGPNVHVSKPRSQTAHAEVVIATDPTNPSRLLAGSMVEPSGDGAGGDSVVTYSSVDGGKTWSLVLEKKGARSGLSYADPTVAYGPDGRAYMGAIGIAGNRKRFLEMASSRDGRIWTAPLKVDHDEDRPFLTVDGTNGRFRGRVYCGCSIKTELSTRTLGVHSSRDGGKTLERVISLPAKNTGEVMPGPGAVLSDGTLVIPYRVKPLDVPATFSFRIRRSKTGGASFLSEESLFVRDFRGENPNTALHPMLTVDPGSSSFKDRLYLVWSEKTPAGLQVMLILSRDQGMSWSHPVVISEQANATNEGRPHHAVLPAIAVNKAGIVGVTWYDTRESFQGKHRCHVRFRASLDGGTTWLPSECVTDIASKFVINDRPGGVARGNWLGHTAGLAADAAGEFHPLWIDDRTGIRQVFTATIAVHKANSRP
jgi:hypothetical protein